MKAEKTFLALGTSNTITLFDSENLFVIEKVIERVNEIDDRMSVFKEDSDISLISRNAGAGFQKVHEETFELIKKAIEFGELSKGIFDVTMGPVIDLWGINRKKDYIPSKTEIQGALQLVSYNDIMLDKDNCAVALKKTGQSIDLGGIAKGYAADEAKRILSENGIKSAIINFGGNIVTVGRKPDGQEWKIGIQNPLAPTGEYLGVLTTTDKTVVTSGSNERFFIKDGIRYHHIIHPYTGRPAQNDLLSVTAVGTSSMDVDAITTALFILGPEKSMELLSKMNMEAVFVTRELSMIVTNGLVDSFRQI